MIGATVSLRPSPRTVIITVSCVAVLAGAGATAVAATLANPAAAHHSAVQKTSALPGEDGLLSQVAELSAATGVVGITNGFINQAVQADNGQLTPATAAADLQAVQAAVAKAQASSPSPLAAKPRGLTLDAAGHLLDTAAETLAADATDGGGDPAAESAAAQQVLHALENFEVVNDSEEELVG
jgi:hypothetical protein